MAEFLFRTRWLVRWMVAFCILRSLAGKNGILRLPKGVISCECRGKICTGKFTQVVVLRNWKFDLTNKYLHNIQPINRFIYSALFFNENYFDKRLSKTYICSGMYLCLPKITTFNFLEYTTSLRNDLPHFWLEWKQILILEIRSFMKCLCTILFNNSF